jgi:hypothetical protein
MVWDGEVGKIGFASLPMPFAKIFNMVRFNGLQIGFLGKILTGSHGFFRQIKGFPVFFSLKPVQ